MLLIEMEEQIGVFYNCNKNNDINQFITDLLYFILFHWYFLALKKSALRKCPYINNEFGQPIFWGVSQIWKDVSHQPSLMIAKSSIYITWNHLRGCVCSHEWPILASIGTGETYHNCSECRISQGIIQDIVIGNQRTYRVLLSCQQCRIYGIVITGLHRRHAICKSVLRRRVNYLKEFVNLNRVRVCLIVLLLCEQQVIASPKEIDI